jgi:CHAD domain-containing protein
VRKKAKRLRYSAESAVPVYGRQARALATRAQKIQQVLGEHQDAVVAQHTLREYGIQAHLGGENAFTFGRLHAREQARAVKAERRFDAAWRDLRRRPVRRWLDGPRRARGRPARSDFR